MINGLIDKERIKRNSYLNQNVDLKFSSIKKKNILIIGDSLSKDMFIALRENLNQNEFDVEYLPFSHWCFEKNNYIDFLNFFSRVQRRNSQCAKEKQRFEKNSKLLKEANYLLFASSWHKNTILYLDKIVDYFKDYTDAKIIVSSKNVMFPDIKKLAIKMEKKELNKMAYDMKYKSVYEFNENFKKKIQSLDLKYLNKTELICSEVNKSCKVYDNKKNTLHLIDAHHWSFSGAKYFGSKINFNYLFK